MTVPDWISPQLATPASDRFSDPAWIFEREFGGQRCLAFAGGRRPRLLTRDREEASRTYPEIAEALAAQHAGDFILDGEVVAFNGTMTSLDTLQQRTRRRAAGGELRRQEPVYYCLFDLLWCEGQDLRGLPLLERKRVLRQRLRFTGPLRFAAHRTAEGEEYWARACDRGWEGVIAKRADAPYRSGRSTDWLEFKCETRRIPTMPFARELNQDAVRMHKSLL